MALSNKNNDIKIVLMLFVVLGIIFVGIGAVLLSSKIAREDNTLTPTEASEQAKCGNNICEESEYIPCPEGSECLWEGSCPQDCKNEASDDTAELNCGFCGMNCIYLTGAEICPMVMPEEGTSCEEVTQENGRTKCGLFRNGELVSTVNDDLDKELENDLTIAKDKYDLNDDGTVGIKDFVSFAPLYLKKDMKVDFNNDGRIDVKDFTEFASGYKKENR